MFIPSPESFSASITATSAAATSVFTSDSSAVAEATTITDPSVQKYVLTALEKKSPHDNADILSRLGVARRTPDGSVRIQQENVYRTNSFGQEQAPEHKCTLPENSGRIVRVTLQREVMTKGRWAIACSKADDTTGSDAMTVVMKKLKLLKRLRYYQMIDLLFTLKKNF